MDNEEKQSKINKDAVIKAEIKRLKGLCKEVPKEKIQMINPLIEHLAFHQYMLLLMEEDISINGVVMGYQHGWTNRGTTTNPAVKSHNSTMTVYLKALKQLVDIAFKDLPAEEKAAKLDDFRCQD